MNTQMHLRVHVRNQDSSWGWGLTLSLHTEWAKSRYRVIIFFFTGIVNDGKELKYRTKKVDFEAVLEN